MLILKRLIALALLAAMTSSAWAQLTPEQQAAKDKGLMFYQQYKRSSAIPELQIAAEAGDRGAQYFLATFRRIRTVSVSA